MNNKVLARIVAAMLAVMMLGTLAFADGTIESTYENGTIGSQVDTEYDEGQNIYTLVAYKADDANATITNANIIAIEQSNDINKIKTITVDTTKVNTRYIKVLYGGNNGVTRTATIDLLDSEMLTSAEFKILPEDHGVYEFVGKDNEGQDKTYKIDNVVKATYTFAPKAGKTITKVGVEFQGTAAKEFTKADGTIIPAGTKTGAAVEKEIKIAGDGAAVEFTAYLFGVPEDDVIAGMSAVPFIEFY